MSEVRPGDGTAAAAIVITGVMAAGKSTVGNLLARRLSCAAHVRGDVFRRMIVTGGEELTPVSTAGATAQLWMRYRISAMVADEYARAGFTAIVQDVILGDDLRRYLALITTRPRCLVVLTPGPDVVVARERARHKVGYGAWTPADLHHLLWQETPPLGLWLDNSDQTPDETVEQIRSDLPMALVPDA